MAVESIGSTPLSSTDISRAALGQEDFLEILLAQLTFQDPLEPMDNQEFIAQMAQFTTLEQSRQTNERIDNLLSVQSSSQALSLLGQKVEFIRSTGNVFGTVTTVTFEQGVPRFSVLEDGTNQPFPGVSLSQIRLVRESGS